MAAIERGGFCRANPSIKVIASGGKRRDFPLSERAFASAKPARPFSRYRFTHRLTVLAGMLWVRATWVWRPSRSRLIVLGFLLPFCILSCCIATGVSALSGSQHTQTPTSQLVTPTDTPTQDTSLLALTPTDTPTDTPIHTDTPTPTPTPIATPTPKPAVIVTPTPRPQPTATHCVGVNNNPWCYDFNPGKYITYPPSGFCSYFNCIATFYAPDDPGDGYVVECQDTTYSQSGGESGACSSHGGVMRPLYSH